MCSGRGRNCLVSWQTHTYMHIYTNMLAFTQSVLPYARTCVRSMHVNVEAGLHGSDEPGSPVAMATLVLSEAFYFCQRRSLSQIIPVSHKSPVGAFSPQTVSPHTHLHTTPPDPCLHLHFPTVLQPASPASPLFLLGAVMTTCEKEGWPAGGRVD